MTRDPATSLVDYYEKTFRKLRMKGQSLKGHHQYLVQLRHFERFLERPATLADLEDETVTALLCDRHEKTSPETANKCRNHILALWRFAARKGHVAAFPDVDRLKERKRIPQAWNHAQIAKLVETAYRGDYWGSQWLKATTGEIPSNLWWTALLMVLYETGIRIGAAFQLRIQDVDLDTGRVLVPAEVQKQYADQAFTLTVETREILRQFAHVQRELLFPWYASNGCFYERWRRLLVAAGLPVGRRSGPHRVRRTTATMAKLHIGRGTATGILGHSSAHVTRAYIDTSMLPENRFAERLPRPLLAAQQHDDGSMPTAAEMLPAPTPAIVPIEHSVSAVILPSIQSRPETDPLLDSDVFALVAEYQATRLATYRRQYRVCLIRQLRKIFTARRFSSPRDIDGHTVLEWLAAQRANGTLTGNIYNLQKTAVGGFLRWLVKDKGVYAMARHVAPFDAFCCNGGRRKNGGAA